MITLLNKNQNLTAHQHKADINFRGQNQYSTAILAHTPKDSVQIKFGGWNDEMKKATNEEKYWKSIKDNFSMHRTEADKALKALGTKKKWIAVAQAVVNLRDKKNPNWDDIVSVVKAGQTILKTKMSKVPNNEKEWNTFDKGAFVSNVKTMAEAQVNAAEAEKKAQADLVSQERNRPGGLNDKMRAALKDAGLL